MESISYIIPHYNSYNSIKKLIDSIVLKNGDEILVVDDCSTDDSYDQLKSLNKDIKLLKNDVNGGAGKARNLGLKHAKNKWIIFADSDDYFISGYRDIIEKYLESSEDLIYFSPESEKISNNKSINGDRHSFYSYLVQEYKKNPTMTNLNNLKYKMVVPWSKIIKKKFIDENDIYFDEVNVSNDVMFATRTGLYANSIGVSTDSIYCCIETDDSMTADTSYIKTYERLKIFIEQYKFLATNLNDTDLENMTITGLSYIIIAIRNKYTLSQFKSLVSLMKQNDIPIFSWRYFVMRSKRTLGM